MTIGPVVAEILINLSLHINHTGNLNTALFPVLCT